MTTFTHTLKPLVLPTGSVLLQPAREPLEHVTVDSPALKVMTDLARVRLITVGADAAVDTALAVMIHAKVRLLLVIGAGGVISGLVSSQDLMGEQPLRVASEQRIHRDAVRVGQIMSRAADIQPLELSDVEHVSVGDIMRHLIDCNRQHALVVTSSGNTKRYTTRGIFSLTQIGRQLGKTINLGDARAENFADLEQLIA